ncbi:DNA recombination protein RmuC [Proteus mirabilis]|uniref:DNA recombination protein RmuC n=1 Tax=Proteus mirabilis TaxID=584 RepID=UPI0012B4C591|nr:DNA recombination protein RmuC [Proteus mirabilis]QGM67559.1 DNA recombination protein RmuC [Proteus mirabilis]HCB2899189.1 DNA recombination protein RmuC [Proteus mirabilis]HCB2908712.1 DNA recombination protein RmuC [Proteus mirabilis]
MDIQLLYGIIGLLGGVLVGGIAVWWLIQQRLAEKENLLRENYTQLAVAQQKALVIPSLQQQIAHLEQELRAQREIITSQEAELREVTTRWEESRISAEEKQRLLLNSEQRLATQFENLANRIFEQSGRKAQELNRQDLTHLLSPFREQLESFRRQVQEGFGQEARERHTLVHEIRQLQQLNVKMAQEAVNLTNALKGDNKIQGNWGETVLARILESSGLREGHEFETQVSIRHENGSRYQPDVIVHLPHRRDVIIDAKMSLIAYERYFNSSDENEQKQALHAHVNSIRAHIKGLSLKDYHKLPGVTSLDYVLMFIPIEPAYLVAIGHSPDLLEEALKNNIMLVGPSTLLVALRTIAALWRYEYQSQNAQEIADRAAKMYDKLRLFVDDMQGLGNSIQKAQSGYLLAMKKLSEGRGNLISQAEGFKSLGVEIKKTIDNDLVEKSASD